MSTKEQPGHFDGMQRAEPNEPVFTLRAHDPLAPALIHDWVDRKRKAIRTAFANGEMKEEKRTLELIQCNEAEEIAWSMDAWRKGEHAAIAEELESADDATQQGYNEHQSGDAEIAARAQYQTIKAAEQLLQNGIAAIKDAKGNHPKGRRNWRISPK